MPVHRRFQLEDVRSVVAICWEHGGVFDFIFNVFIDTQCIDSAISCWIFFCKEPDNQNVHEIFGEQIAKIKFVAEAILL